MMWYMTTANQLACIGAYWIIVQSIHYHRLIESGMDLDMISVSVYPGFRCKTYSVY